jgi:septal ring factor EnvC (AmiA/AmiB activator)
LRATFLALVVLVAGSAWADKKEEKKEELLELQQRIQALTRELNDSEESKTQAADQLRESERAISKAKRELNKINSRLEESNKELARLRAESAKLEDGIAGEKSNLARLLREMHRHPEEKTLKLFLDRGDANTLARELAYYRYLAQARAEMLESLRSDLHALQQVAAAREQLSAEIEDLKARQTSEKQALEEQRRERQLVLKGLSKQIREQRNEISTLKQNEARLTELIERLAKAVKPRKKPAAAIRRSVEAKAQDADFYRLKGKLSLPVKGELQNRFGASREDSGLTWKGLFIHAAAGAKVHAVAAGKVVFADWLRGFGNLLIVDHGEGFMSLYGFNEALHRQVGENIDAGEPIADVGASGGARDTGVYFEMRHQGKPFDPLDWVRLK